MFGEKSDQKLLAMGVMGVSGGHGGVMCPKYFYQFFRLQMPWNGENINKNILTHDPHMTPAMTPMTPGTVDPNFFIFGLKTISAMDKRKTHCPNLLKKFAVWENKISKNGQSALPEVRGQMGQNGPKIQIFKKVPDHS